MRVEYGISRNKRFWTWNEGEAEGEGRGERRGVRERWIMDHEGREKRWKR